ncbi:peroxisomal N(1)-acetyl-spermine/spermidine oxidase-like [Bombus vosnesenskii]|uniref:Peroxisomal N(1)-acetyl-spermine/spermidine oxidase-like n=2 Tax=Pyrobombus TaxID=144703 RepID=A0A6J3LKU6_9HYME|nr:peroxisomal N(1)-acetyl-spermine/spermidine oxidase [Bombus impatiens]XP_033202145.1 peroxisomal N(1)-acetyl-spermine/spermidine oxidase-like [Bombus vancouverensis nearcticus]XP_033365825.1 peroxisomal N(1)-acetyl-spermine/spermidine oxidase-like [Bombus vosnesenskii]
MSNEMLLKRAKLSFRIFRTILVRNFASSKGGKEKDIPPCPKLARFETCQLDPCMLDPCKPEPTVVIIGAGMAGLSAAHRLAQCGLQNFTILEATDRPGGRIHSCWLGDVVAEMGATWIEGGCVANPVFTLAAQEGLLKPPLFRPDPSRGLFCTSDGRAIDLPVSITAYHTFRQIEQQAATLFSLGCGRTHGTLLNFMGVRIQQELHNFPEEQRYDAARVMYGMTNCVRCRCGDDLSLVSADQFGSYIEIPGGNVRVPLGYVGVLAPLLRDLPSCALKYCKPVSCIRWGAISDSCPRAVVKCCDGEEFPADYVIVTVSLGVLKHQHDKLFCPALPAEKVEAICKLGYGYVNKIFLEYARPFWVWKEGGIKLAWSADELADRCDWVKGISIVEELSTSQHVLCAWVCGREAADMELCSDEEVVESITRVLRQFTGDPTLPYPANLLRSKWCMDQYFAGSCSYMGMNSTVGHQCDLASPLPGTCEPIPPILLFAGEATIPGHYSTVHGARLSGIREAERIIQLTKRFGGPPTKTSDNS